MSNNKKILVFHHAGAIGGGGVSMLHILKTLKSLSYDIKVICPGNPSHMIDEISKMGIEAEGIFDKHWVYPHFNGQSYNAFDPRYQRRWKHIKSSFDTIREIVKKESPDVVVLNSMTLSWMIECIDDDIKTVCFDRETLPNDGNGKRCRMIINWLSRMTKSVYLSEYDKKAAGNHKNSCVITDKVDIQKFDNIPDKSIVKCPLELDFDKKHILFTGGMWKVKGSHTALEMMHYLNDDYRLIFMQYTVGELASDKKSIIKRNLGMDYEANTLALLEGIENKVHFFAPQQDIVPFFAACDIVIFPSTLPHQARPVYEAGAAYRPVIISDFENTKEFAINNYNALTFKPDNAKALAECVVRLEDRKLSYRLSDNGRKMCEQKHDLNDMETEIKLLFESIEEE